MKWMIALVSFVLLAAWMQPLRAADEPYDLYAITSQTGSAAFLGRDEVPGLQAAEKYVNAHGGIRGRPLHIVIEDDQSNPQITVQLANQLIAKGVPAILGPGLGTTCAAVAPLVEANGPVMYPFTNTGPTVPGSYAFLYGNANKDFTANAFRFLKAKGVRKLAVLVTTDATGQDAEKGAEEVLQYPDLRDMQIVDVEHFATTDLTVAAQVARIKASGAEAIDAYITGTAFGTALRGIHEADYSGWVLTTAANGSKVQMQQYLQFLPDKLIITALGYQMTGGVPARVNAVKAEFRGAVRDVGLTDLAIGNMVPWDPVMLVVGALRQYGPQATARQVRDFILSQRDWAGNMGMYNFARGDQRGLDPKSTGVMRYDKNAGDFVVISKPGGEPL